MLKWWRARRRARRSRIATQIAERTGGVAQAGPFAGLRYVQPQAVGSTLAPKLLGTYELEIQPALEQALGRAPDRVINCGAGEGWYAVGVALRLPRADVIAFESDAHGRALCTALAEHNGVAERVRVEGLCTVERLRELTAEPALVICDVEGAELELLDPAAVPGLTRCEIVAEMHGRGMTDSADVIAARFETTHDVARITFRGRTAADADGADYLSRRDRREAVQERRRAGLRWLHLEPRPHRPEHGTR